ncbi:ABC transporter substrate-binding protein [Arthrobacter sp. KNU40]|uniref:ABC transporter substrate-binding protein n=1 Tax=Arthrobacter sp. KNU40 TaxID=3447965 RepID=UPI003F61E84D
MKLSRLTAAALVAATALGIAGCGGNSASGANSSSTLTLGAITSPSTFAAADADWAGDSPFYQAVYDTVLRANPDGSIAAGLASDWSYNADKTVLTLKVRTDASFSDGTKVDAAAVAQNILHHRDGQAGGKSRLAAVQDATPSDPQTVTVKLSHADPSLLTFLTMDMGLVESPATFTAKDVKTNPIGSGPYILDQQKTVAGNTYAFTRNKNYWDAKSVHYDNLVIKVIGDPTAMVNAIKGGQVNAADMLNLDGLAAVKASGFTQYPNELDFAGLALIDRGGKLNPALGDVRVRKAINYAFDRQALANAIMKGNATVTEQIYGPGSPAFDSSLDSSYSYDPSKAKQLLAEAGYADGFTLEMPSWTAIFGTSLFSIIQQQLGDVGITVKYSDDATNYVSDIIAGKFPAAYLQLSGDIAKGEINANEYLAPTAGWNGLHYEDAKLTALMQKAQNSSGAAHDQALKEINAYVVDQAWFATWYRPQSMFVADSKTMVTVQEGNRFPYLWNIVPKS